MKTGKEVLLQALKTLCSVEIDYYNHNRQNSERFAFEAIGKTVILKRTLAEMTEQDLNLYLLPGERAIEDDDDKTEWYRFATPVGDELGSQQQNFIINTLLPMFNGLGGIQDSDDACLRCARRMLAEVAGHPNLNNFRLLMEKEIKPIYYSEYTPVENLKE